MWQITLSTFADSRRNYPFDLRSMADVGDCVVAVAMAVDGGSPVTYSEEGGKTGSRVEAVAAVD